ncbi:MAG TPA: cell division protein ZapB [Vicinamibacterales bacterium]|nr:cell division protein ZapB [Vicinamibacterales bacterium]
MAKTATQTAAGFEPIDRLEQKLKMLVSVVQRMKNEQAKAADENQRLSREIEQLRARLAGNDGLASEVTALKGERDVIRSRVSEMLDQLEALNL